LSLSFASHLPASIVSPLCIKICINTSGGRGYEEVCRPMK
jgi:hypothetical protein